MVPARVLGVDLEDFVVVFNRRTKVASAVLDHGAHLEENEQL